MWKVNVTSRHQLGFCVSSLHSCPITEKRSCHGDSPPPFFFLLFMDVFMCRINAVGHFTWRQVHSEAGPKHDVMVMSRQDCGTSWLGCVMSRRGCVMSRRGSAGLFAVRTPGDGSEGKVRSKITWTQDGDAILLSAGRHTKPEVKNHPNDPSKSLVFTFVRGPTFPIIPFDKLERRSWDHLFIMRSVDLEDQWGSAVVHCGKCRTQCFRALTFDPSGRELPRSVLFLFFFRFFSPSTCRGSFAFLAASERSVFPSFLHFFALNLASHSVAVPSRLAVLPSPAGSTCRRCYNSVLFTIFFWEKKEKKLLG